MIKCQACGRNNRENSQYCDECGRELSATFASAEKNQIEVPNFSSQIAETPIFQSSKATSIGIPAVQFESSKEADTFGNAEKLNGIPRATLIIDRGDSLGTEFPLSSDESNIGRWDADNGIFPDVDLDRHDPEAKISRRHARIICQNGKFLIEDLGSTNGTFVNRGRRLIPGNPNVLSNGDEIIVGKTFLRFYINE